MSLICKVLIKVTGKMSKYWRFIHLKQSSISNKKIELLGDDTYNCSVVNTKLHELKEHYQKLGKEKDFEAFESDWKLKNLNNWLSHEHLYRG